jgi:hypothetical protein
MGIGMQLGQVLPCQGLWTGDSCGLERKEEVRYLYNSSVYMSDQFFYPQVKNKPHHGFILPFILEHGAVANSTCSAFSSFVLLWPFCFSL